MEADAVNLPEGYTLDAPSDGLPEGYTIDPPQNPIETAGRALLRNIPLAQQAVAGVKGMYSPLGQETKAYSDELQHLTESAEQGKAQNPKAYGLGAVTGTLAPLALGQPEGIAGNMALNAGLTAAQGVSDTNLVQQPGLAAKQAGQGALVGAGTAGILGKLGEYLGSKFAPKAAEAVTEPVAETAAKAAPGASLEAAGPSAQAAPATRTPGGIVPDQTPVSPDFVPTADRIAASNWARAIGFTPRKFQQFANEIGENPQSAALEGQKWSEEKGLVKWMDHPGEALARITPIKEKAGETIGAALDKFGIEPIPASDIQADIDHLAKITPNQAAKGTLNGVSEIIGDMAQDGTLNWRTMNEIKGIIGKEVGDHPNISKAYGLLAQRMNATADAASAKIGDPTLRASYEAAKRDYRMASLLEPALNYSESKNLIGGAARHNTLRGVLGQLTEALTGLPPVGQLAKNAMARTAPVVKAVGNAGRAVANSLPAKAAGAAAIGAGSLIKGLPKEAQYGLSNYLESKYGKKGQ